MEIYLLPILFGIKCQDKGPMVVFRQRVTGRVYDEIVTAIEHVNEAYGEITNREEWLDYTRAIRDVADGICAAGLRSASATLESTEPESCPGDAHVDIHTYMSIAKPDDAIPVINYYPRLFVVRKEHK